MAHASTFASLPQDRPETRRERGTERWPLPFAFAFILTAGAGCWAIIGGLVALVLS